MTADGMRRPLTDRHGLGLLLAALCALLAVLAPASAHATDIQHVVSSQGIEAWLVEERSVPLISMQFAFAGGARLDPDDKAGLASMASALLDEGAGDLDAQAFQASLEKLSIGLSFSAGQDSFIGSLRTLSRHADKAFELLTMAVNAPRFDADAVERVRAAIITGLHRRQQDPQSVASDTWYRLAFADHPYGRPVEGTPETVAGIGRDDLSALIKRSFTRDRLKIAVVGDIDAERLKQVLDEVFATLPEKGEDIAIADAELTPGPARRIVDMAIPQAVIQFGTTGLARKDPDFIPAFVVNHILGGGSFSSRLYTEVREKRGLAYSVYTYLYPMDHAALLVGGVATQNERAGESLRIIEAELRRMAEEGPTPEELADAKSFLTGSYALRFDTGSRIAGQLLAIQLDDLGIDYINRRNGLIEAVTMEDVRRAAKRLLEDDRLLVTVVGRPAGLAGDGDGN